MRRGTVRVDQPIDARSGHAEPLPRLVDRDRAVGAERAHRQSRPALHARTRQLPGVVHGIGVHEHDIRVSHERFVEG
jgi:hypothetical protein